MKIDIELIIEIVKFIFELIKKGKSQKEAISQAALKFSISPIIIEEIFKKHGK